MVTDVVINEARNEEVRVIIPRLHAQDEWRINFLASLLKFVSQQLIRQELVILPLPSNSNVTLPANIKISKKKN